MEEGNWWRDEEMEYLPNHPPLHTKSILPNSHLPSPNPKIYPPLAPKTPITPQNPPLNVSKTQRYPHRAKIPQKAPKVL